MIDELWNRYARIWSLDAAGRDRELAACVAANVAYADPNVSIEGAAELSRYMAGFQTNAPGHSLRIKAVKQHHDRSIARWDLVGPNGAVASPGISFAVSSADGKFLNINGFFGEGLEGLFR